MNSNTGIDKIERYGNLSMYFSKDQLVYAYSYDTCVMTRNMSTGVAIVNRSKYSPTTAKQITRRIFPALGNEAYVEVTGLPFNVMCHDLLVKAEAANV